MGNRARRVVFIADFDNTLYCRDDASVLPQNLQAVERLRAAGHVFVIATGRSEASLTKVFSDWRRYADYVLFDSGAICVDVKNDEILWTEQFDEYESKNLDGVLDEFFDMFSPTKEFKSVYYYRGTESATPLSQVSRRRVWVKDAETAQALRKYLSETMDELVTNQDDDFGSENTDLVGGDKGAFVDITPPRGGKDVATSRLCDDVLATKDVVAIGDDWDDATMLKQFNGFIVADSKSTLIKTFKKDHCVGSVAELVDRLLVGRLRISCPHKMGEKTTMAITVMICFAIMFGLFGLMLWAGTHSSTDSMEDDLIAEEEEESAELNLAMAAKELCDGEATLIYEGQHTEKEGGIFMCDESGVLVEIDWRGVLSDGIMDISVRYLGKAHDEMIEKHFPGERYIYRPSQLAAQDALYILVGADSQDAAIQKTYEGLYGVLTDEERSGQKLEVVVFYGIDLSTVHDVKDYLVLAAMTRQWQGQQEFLNVDRRKVQVTGSDLAVLQELAGTPEAYATQTRDAIKNNLHFRATFDPNSAFGKKSEYIRLAMTVDGSWVQE